MNMYIAKTHIVSLHTMATGVAMGVAYYDNVHSVS